MQIYDLGEWWDLRGTISMRRLVDNLEPTLLMTIIYFLIQGHNLKKTIN